MAKAKPAKAAAVGPEVTVGPEGRIAIPAEFRRTLGIRPGDQLITWLEGDCLVVRSKRAVVAELRGIFKDLAPGRSLVDELIAERREEARREGST